MARPNISFLNGEVNSLTLHVTTIGMQLFILLSTSSGHLERSLFSLIELTVVSLGIRILIGQKCKEWTVYFKLLYIHRWKSDFTESKRQAVISRSSTEAEYWAMPHATSELLRLKDSLQELDFVDWYYGTCVR